MTKPEPLVPSACTMAGNDWFPLHFDRLRKSKWWRRATDLARARNVMLWGEAYKQQPAGSMPDDDDDLAEAAGFGMDVEGFMAAKAEIMAPWVLCSDGRWYHPTVCEVVLEAWERASEKKKSAAAKKAAQRAKTRGHSPPREPVPPETPDVPTETANVPRDTAENQGDIDTHNRQDRTDRTDSTPQPPEGADELFLGQPEHDPPDEVRVAFDLWNDVARRCGLPVAKSLDDGRRRAIRKRLEDGGLEFWKAALGNVEASAFLRGQRPGTDGRSFRADLTFVCQAKSYQRLLDGGYGIDAVTPVVASLDPTADPWPRRVQEFAANGYWRAMDWGPKPGREGCKVPPSTLREFGIEPSPPQAVNGAAA